jgi:hypothetical protein
MVQVLFYSIGANTPQKTVSAGRKKVIFPMVCSTLGMDTAFSLSVEWYENGRHGYDACRHFSARES